MRSVVTVLAAIPLLLGVQAGSAADSQAPIMKEPPVWQSGWTGFYVGGNAGYVQTARNAVSNAFTDTGTGGLGAPFTRNGLGYSPSVFADGFMGGGQIGYNYQMDRWLVGVEVDFDYSSAKTTMYSGPITLPGFVPIQYLFARELDWLGTFRGRAGFLVNPTLLAFVSGGGAWGRTKFTNQFVCPVCGPPASSEATTVNTVTNTSFGWTAGGGTEWMFAPRWSFKAEYLHVDLGSHSSTITYTYGVNVSTATSSVRDAFNIARVGINFHF